jgi:hypothetical protein
MTYNCSTNCATQLANALHQSVHDNMHYNRGGSAVISCTTWPLTDLPDLSDEIKPNDEEVTL